MDRLESAFGALADRTRRAMLERMRSGERSVSELARAQALSLSGALKHIRVLEAAGLLHRQKRGRTVWCRLNAAPLREVGDWVARYRVFWDDQLDALEKHLAQGNRRGQR